VDRGMLERFPGIFRACNELRSKVPGGTTRKIDKSTSCATGGRLHH
jgi:hypothetical protein